MATEEQRQERRQLKQKLWQIRLFVEGDRPKLTKELETLKENYEALDGFTNWSEFPEKWDVGDPNGVKANLATSNDKALTDIDRANFQALQGKDYETIVIKNTPAGKNLGEDSGDVKGKE